MDETGQKLLNLMFRPNETICLSPNQYGYHSVPLENALQGVVTLVPTVDSLAKRKLTLEEGIERIDSSKMILCALNPIKGYREDANCTSFRNFLIEMDYGPLPEQLAYIKKLGVPYSAVVFSGNKSLHFLVSLDTDLPSEKIYRTFSEWILNIITLADQQTKNPSRSIRIPGAYREPDKKQRMVEFRGATRLDDLVVWLNKYPDAKPKQREERKVSENPDLSGVKDWVCKMLVDGIQSPERNKKWFTVAVEFALSGFSEDDTIDVLRNYFSPERDFREKEWESAIRSGFKWTYARKE